MVTSQARLEELVKTMRTVFCQELGPVSVNAQMKVAPPDGLVLNENLVELAGMVSEDDSTPSTSIFFYPCSRHSVDTRDEPAVSICLSSLSEHRKRHGLFYLQTGKTEDEPNDYPQANDSLPSSSNNSVNDDKLKTAELVFGRKKSTTTKSRPKVVKLDTEDFLSSMTTRAAPSQPGIEGCDHGIKKIVTTQRTPPPTILFFLLVCPVRQVYAYTNYNQVSHFLWTCYQGYKTNDGHL